MGSEGGVENERAGFRMKVGGEASPDHDLWRPFGAGGVGRSRRAEERTLSKYMLR